MKTKKFHAHVSSKGEIKNVGRGRINHSATELGKFDIFGSLTAIKVVLVYSRRLLFIYKEGTNVPNCNATPNFLIHYVQDNDRPF